MIEIYTEEHPILIWAGASDLIGFDSAIEQAKNLANHPLTAQHVALMPDFHIGYGMPIGGVLATKGGVIPNAVGVDIGCGMIAAKTSLEADSIDQTTLERLRHAIHARVPVGNGPGGSHKAAQDLSATDLAMTSLPVIEENSEPARRQLGTLGGGNHFIEIQRDAEGYVWLMVHSGSRNLGKRVCDYYDAIAKEYTRSEGFPAVAERGVDLSFLPETAPEYEHYLASMRWCMAFAESSRERMLDSVCSAMSEVLVDRIWQINDAVQTHHNYAALEEHQGEILLVHRKGAVRAEGPVIIPGSMGTASYIGRGLATPMSFETCSHGAGRVMGRKEANRTISHEEAVKAMEGVVFGIRQGDYEEMPQAYKDIHHVMANQRDLVEPTDVLRPLAVVKG